MRVAGLPAVQALFATAPDRVERLFFSGELRRQLVDFCGVLAWARKPYRQVGNEELARVAGTVLHGGVVALARPRPVRIFDVSEATRWAKDGKLLLLLDGIGNPHNLGAIARTAAFFGLPRIVLSDNPAQALPSDASYRVAEGGLDRLEVYKSAGFVHDIEALRRSYFIVGASAEGGQAVAQLAKADKPLALVLGNEERGFPPATARACDALVTIAGAGAIQSLNVAATAAVLVYALVGQ
ncbi:MAG TPA: TrmH family RNA methyltransferase [Reyranella sp.]|nr:TrmH family RNA methyltransferase [Reyranella sp.]